MHVYSRGIASLIVFYLLRLPNKGLKSEREARRNVDSSGLRLEYLRTTTISVLVGAASRSRRSLALGPSSKLTNGRRPSALSPSGIVTSFFSLSIRRPNRHAKDRLLNLYETSFPE